MNHCGAPIPKLAGITTKNSNGIRYILRARDMRRYLKHVWGPPDYKNFGTYHCVPDSQQFLKALKIGDGVDVFASDGHVGIIKAGYADPVLSNQGMVDIWKMP